MTANNDERKLRLEEMNISDNGGRRKSVDRRQFAYTIHIPERRVGNDRRNGTDRRRSNRSQLTP